MRSKYKFRYLFLALFILSHCIFFSQINFSPDFRLGTGEISTLTKVNREEIIPFTSSSPYLISNFTDSIGSAQGVFIQDDILFLTDSINSSMTIIDISNPIEPIYLDWFQSAETITSGAFVEENIAYLPSNFGLEILNVSVPNNIDWISWYDDGFGGSTNDVVVIEDIAYVSRASDAFEIINVSNPNNPEKINQIEGNFFEIMIKDYYAFIIEDSIALNIINITDPSNSTGTFKVMKRLEFADISDVFFNGDVMYVVEPTAGLFAYNIINPINPQYITSLEMGGYWQGKKAFIEKDIAYISTMNGDVKIINVTDPYNLEVMDEYTGDGGSGNDIFVKDGIIYLADGADGLEIIDGGYGVDTDGDGLTDFQEINLYNTDPNSTDTDGDSYDDGYEISEGTDPLDPNDYPIEIELEAPIIMDSDRTVNYTTIRFEWQEVLGAENYYIYLYDELYTSTENTWIQLTFNTEGVRIFTVTAVSGNNESEHSNPLKIIFDFPDDNNDNSDDDSDNSSDDNAFNDPFAQISIPGYSFEIFGLSLIFAVLLKESFIMQKKKR